MKQTDKLNWIKLLRSNKYKQCFGRIQEPYTNQRCALGVCFEAMNLNKNKFVEESLKLNLSFGEIVTVTKLNDIEYKSFNQIADYIENNIKGE